LVQSIFKQTSSLGVYAGSEQCESQCAVACVTDIVWVLHITHIGHTCRIASFKFNCLRQSCMYVYLLMCVHYNTNV